MAIKTTGQLRSELSTLMDDVKNRRIKADTALVMLKAAGRITESLYSEAKIAQIAAATGQKVAELGRLDIGDSGASDT